MSHARQARARHTMNPVIVTKEGKPFLICGTPGADTQVQTNLQLITHVVDFGMTPQEAVEAPALAVIFKIQWNQLYRTPVRTHFS